MDGVAHEYLLLGLALGDLQEGIVDSYFGPPEIRAEATAAALDAPSIAARARVLRGSLDGLDIQRATWLDRQLVAVATLADILSDKQLPYVEEVERCFDAYPNATPAETYAELHRALDALLPGAGDLRARLEERNDRLTIPADRLPQAIEWLVEQLRDRARQFWPLPEGESLTVSIVTNQPWSAYNWYDGNLTSRVEVNTDEPVRAHQLIDTMAHETFPGHHLEHAWKEARLVGELERWESSILLINTPEAYISEGLAELGARLVAPPADRQQLLVDLCALSGIPMSNEQAERELEINRHMRSIRGSSADAALKLHAEGMPRDQVIDFLEQQALRTNQEATRTLSFIEHPLWRSYIFCYAGGDRLLTRWCEAAGDLAAQRDRFFRLLTEQLTPSGIELEMAPSS